MITKKSLSQKGKSGKSSFAKRYKTDIKRAYPHFNKSELRIQTSSLYWFVEIGLRSESEVESSIKRRIQLMEGRFIA